MQWGFAGLLSPVLLLIAITISGGIAFKAGQATGRTWLGWLIAVVLVPGSLWLVLPTVNVLHSAGCNGLHGDDREACLNPD